MIDFVKTPNLPEGKVCEIICGTDDKNILDFFNCNGIKVIKNKSNSFIDPAVAAHTDMAVLHLGNNSIIVDKTQSELKKKLENEGFLVYETEREVKGEYPGDVLLNFTCCREYVIGNFRYADKRLVGLLSQRKLINTKQGYCKCSTLLLNENSVITDDESIHKAVRKNGIDSLLISKGDISLSGHEYGFIGGASGKISKDTVVFFGNIEKHRNFKEIVLFLRKHNCNYICTDKNELRDIGGFLPVKESINI